MSSYDAVIATPFGHVGVRVSGDRLIGVNFLGARTRLKPPRTPLARRACAELATYCADPRHRFRIPLTLAGTPYQRRVWRALTRIPPGEVRSYGDLARRLKSGPRALAQACRVNPVPIVVPCHRVVARNGLGGFMGRDAGAALRLKQSLLSHERRN